jgi:formylglycine-generating enzyme required for sulfatase activity
MVWIPDGSFTMGSDEHYPEEAPSRDVEVRGFWIDPYPVTNARFGDFVAATGHVTAAERAPTPQEYPLADPALLVPASIVFTPPAHRVDLSDHLRWWSLVPGADWRHPDGPGSTLDGLDEHPVVHVAYEDAAAYAAWAGAALPTETEWEYAASSATRSEFAWGDTLIPDGVHMANVWQGEFPMVNLRSDGFERTSPVGSFPANRFGLFDMIGNVWEWTSSAFGTHRAGSACCGADGEGTQEKVMKGGSFLCAPNYCQRYRPAARMRQTADTSTCHLGFRVVVRES